MIHGAARAPSGCSALAPVDETALPDDTLLLGELNSAIELRKREDFDRILDAREPGELVERGHDGARLDTNTA